MGGDRDTFRFHASFMHAYCESRLSAPCRLHTRLVRSLFLVPAQAELFPQHEKQRPPWLNEDAALAAVHEQSDPGSSIGLQHRRSSPATILRVVASTTAPAPTDAKNPRRLTPFPQRHDFSSLSSSILSHVKSQQVSPGSWRFNINLPR